MSFSTRALRWFGAVAVMMLFVGPLSADTPIELNTQDMTPLDMPLTFSLERATWSEGNLLIWGVVTNQDTSPRTKVMVHFTVADEGDQFLGEGHWESDPPTLNEGGQGQITACTIITHGSQPVSLHYWVEGTAVNQ
ncbi:MAG: hypothetical protein JW818_13485 [Pirellulales bacterium]|nr:hypothetical protein [Pirellulales bacterium]